MSLQKASNKRSQAEILNMYVHSFRISPPPIPKTKAYRFRQLYWQCFSSGGREEAVAHEEPSQERFPAVTVTHAGPMLEPSAPEGLTAPYQKGLCWSGSSPWERIPFLKGCILHERFHAGAGAREE